MTNNMDTIILDGQPVETLAPESLPLLVHGEEGSGASLYTICLAAKWFLQKHKILFLCGYPMAQEQFAKQLEERTIDRRHASFYTQEQAREFATAIAAEPPSSQTIIVVKNVELFSEDLIKLVLERKNLIISGDVNAAPSRNSLLVKPFSTTVLFSSLGETPMPPLQRYQGLVTSGTYRGVTSIMPARLPSSA